jgi:predicted nucleic acid-binding protein
MILVYAGFVPSKSGEHSADSEDRRVRSRLLMHRLFRDKATIFLPTVAISELLVPVPSAQRGALVALLTEKFVCLPFDLAAAAIAADLWSQHKKLPQDQQYGSRHVLRADTFIVASVRAAGATAFYSHDRQCRALASLVMAAHDLPRDDPDDMFLREDIRRGDV